MKYEKPHILALKSALQVITTVQLDKGQHFIPDRFFPNPTFTGGAYEADE